MSNTKLKAWKTRGNRYRIQIERDGDGWTRLEDTRGEVMRRIRLHRC